MVSSTQVVSLPGSPALECEYAGRAWYLFSREHDVIKRGQTYAEFVYRAESFTFCLSNYTLNCLVCRVLLLAR